MAYEREIIEVIPIGTKCKTTIGWYCWIITSIELYPWLIQYKVVYENNGLVTQAFYETELEFTNNEYKKQTIWFRTL